MDSMQKKHLWMGGAAVATGIVGFAIGRYVWPKMPATMAGSAPTTTQLPTATAGPAKTPVSQPVSQPASQPAAQPVVQIAPAPSPASPQLTTPNMSCMQWSSLSFSQQYDAVQRALYPGVGTSQITSDQGAAISLQVNANNATCARAAA